MDESRASQRDDPHYTRPEDPAFGPLGAQEVQHVERRLARTLAIGGCVFFLAVWIVASSSDLGKFFFDEEPATEQRVQANKPVVDKPTLESRRSVIRPSVKAVEDKNEFVDASQYGANCEAVTQTATRDPRWKQDLSLTVPQEILDASIPAYQIQWFNGTWSKWYTTGDGDIDWKDNGPGRQRRVWSYFFDHNHRFVACATGSDAVAVE